MDEEIFTAYITKYALTKGVYEEVVRSTHSPELVISARNNCTAYYGHGKDWHRTRESANSYAIIMRDKRLASLKRQMDKLTAMTFA